MRNRAIRGAAILLLAVRAAAPVWAGAKPETVQAFNRYIRRAEARIDARLEGGSGFLWADTPERREEVRRSNATGVCEPLTGSGGLKVQSGLIHDWMGAVFVPDASVADVLALVQDYDRHERIYRPDVIGSRLIERRGNNFRVRLRLRRKQVRTVVLDTEHRVEYRQASGHWWTSRSYSTRIVEIANPGGAAERPVGEGEDHGYLWQLNSYWSFRQQDGGVYVECEAISLTRGIPAALGFVLKPIVRNLPRDAVLRTLRQTRAAVTRAGDCR